MTIRTTQEWVKLIKMEETEMRRNNMETYIVTCPGCGEDYGEHSDMRVFVQPPTCHICKSRLKVELKPLFDFNPESKKVTCLACGWWHRALTEGAAERLFNHHRDGTQPGIPKCTKLKKEE